MAKLKYDLSEQKIGELKVIGRAGGRGSMWECRCSCGVVKLIQSDHLRSGRVHSCGHLKVKYTDRPKGMTEMQNKVWRARRRIEVKRKAPVQRRKQT